MVVAEGAFTAWDIYDMVRTLNDPCANDLMKGMSIGGLLAGAFLPTGGYGTAGKAIVKRAAVRQGRRNLLASGSETATKLADDMMIVRGGTAPLPPPGEIFSGAYGQTLEEAASGVPHGQIRVTTAGEIYAGGGTVEIVPELTRSGVLNERHVNVCLGPGPCPFGPLQPNPVPRSGRIQ